MNGSGVIRTFCPAIIEPRRPPSVEDELHKSSNGLCNYPVIKRAGSTGMRNDANAIEIEKGLIFGNARSHCAEHERHPQFLICMLTIILSNRIFHRGPLSSSQFVQLFFCRRSTTRRTAIVPSLMLKLNQVPFAMVPTQRRTPGIERPAAVQKIRKRHLARHKIARPLGRRPRIRARGEPAPTIRAGYRLALRLEGLTGWRIPLLCHLEKSQMPHSVSPLQPTESFADLKYCKSASDADHNATFNSRRFQRANSKPDRDVEEAVNHHN
ncbi:predicted protein [Histoplasma capsulatum H143]|uniref:Uncharacterized protein n=1 Tax=Ajellomyces capsulatus (strain H143) TaxID=544712 RepID=C6H6Q8_AJECH|nr:predicted protein [Histoplasma capsulatum H143]